MSPYCGQGDLNRLLYPKNDEGEKMVNVNFEQGLKIFFHLLCALDQIHSVYLVKGPSSPTTASFNSHRHNLIMHRDIKPSNILVNTSGYSAQRDDRTKQ
mmetsp:Transcript_13253/g.22491  ORF Transcript_13253/g.22491 Transcript_13253/m.22491 type:complete len:99 (-) Transcript_13253:618-914(-)